MKFSIEAHLLTSAFFGSNQEIVSGTYSRTLAIPTMYTMTGALFTQLIRQQIINPDEIKEMIKNKKLNVYGIYLKYENEYYIPVCYQLIDKVDKGLELKLKLIDISDKYGDTLTLAFNKFIKPYDMGERDVLYLINLSNINHKIISLDIMEEERTRIGIRYPARVVEEGILFTTIHKDFNLSMTFCIDVLIENEKVKKLENWIGNLGGEGTTAKFEIKEQTYLADKVKTGYEAYIAVSHIPIILKGNKIISNLGEIDAIIGSVEPIGGWLLEKDTQKMKRIFASIKPGSYFRIKDKDNKIESDLWYLNLLKSAVPINFLK